MLIGGISGAIILVVILFAYACLRVSTMYDREIDDQMQEAFVRKYKSKTD